METTERDYPLTVEEAIKISKIICSVSDERLPIIVDVFTNAGIDINGLDEIEILKVASDGGFIVDIDELHSTLIQEGIPHGDDVMLRPDEFKAVCEQYDIKPAVAKRALHKKKLIKTARTGNKLDYTIKVWDSENMKPERFVVIMREAQPNG